MCAGFAVVGRVYSQVKRKKLKRAFKFPKNPLQIHLQAYWGKVKQEAWSHQRVD